MHDPTDLVLIVVLDHHQTGMSRGDRLPQGGADALSDVHRHHRGDRRHHLTRLLLVKMEDPGEHLRLTDVKMAARLGLGDQPLELLRGAVRRLGVGIDAEASEHPLGGGVERDDERPEEDDEGLHGRGDPAGKGLGVLDRVELGNDLADGALEEDDQQIGDPHAYGHGYVASAVLPEDRLERVGDGRLAECSDADRGHRDPDLAGGDVVADLLHVAQCQARTTRAAVGELLESRAA